MNQTDEDLKNQAMGWIIALLAMALAAVGGAGLYSPFFGVGAVILFAIWSVKKNKPESTE